MKQPSDRPSLVAAFRLNLRALRLLYRYCPQLVASSLVCTVWDALTPYVGIYLSALVIDELAGGRNVHRLVTLVLVTLIAAALIALGSALLKRWKNPQTSGQWLKTTHILSEKLLDTDYVNLDDTHTSELLSTIRQSDNGSGWGLKRVIGCCEDLLSSLFTMLGGLALTVSLFVTKVPPTRRREPCAAQ